MGNNFKNVFINSFRFKKILVDILKARFIASSPSTPPAILDIMCLTQGRQEICYFVVKI